MKLSISNIGWNAEEDECVLELMQKHGFIGLEIAPTKIFPENPYEKIGEAKNWVDKLKASHGFKVSSMQSIWYGRSEKIFGNEEERDVLLSYTKRAIDFAEILGCKNLVFGCPKNRSIPEGANIETALHFFKTLGDYAFEHNTVVAMEANPPIYNTNFLNTTNEAIDFIEKVDSKGFLLNLDVGTMIENGESLALLKKKENLINHVHISEPGLKKIQNRNLHKELASLLRKKNYDRYISIEVGLQGDIEELSRMMDYVKEIFG